MRKILFAVAIAAAASLSCAHDARAQTQTIIGPSQLPTPNGTPTANDVIVGTHAGQGTVGIPIKALFNGLRGSQCNLSHDFGAIGNDTTDDGPAINSALAAYAAGVCNTIVLDQNKTYLDNESFVPALGAVLSPGTSNIGPLRITGNGEGWGYSQGQNTPSNNSGSLDLRYAGADGLYPAKMDFLGGGAVEIDHINIVDNGTDDFPFGLATNSTMYIHDNVIQGDTTKSGINAAQDWFHVGSSGAFANSLSTTSGSTTVTIGSGDVPFTPSMVGYNFNYQSASNYENGPLLNAYIASYISPTQVTLNVAPSVTISGGVANYFPGDGSPRSGIYAPWQGYGSLFERNEFYHIRRLYIMGNYSNEVRIQSEQVSSNSGCNSAVIPNCAPIYFDRISTADSGAVIQDELIESTNYPYDIYVDNQLTNSQFVRITNSDPSASNFCMIYYNSTSSVNNSTSIAYYNGYGSDPYLNTVSASAITSTGSQTMTLPANVPVPPVGAHIEIDPDTSGSQEWVTITASSQGALNVTGSMTAVFAKTHPVGIRVMGNTPIDCGPGANLNSQKTTGINTADGDYEVQAATFGGTTSNPRPLTITSSLLLPSAGNGNGSLPGISDGGSVAYAANNGSVVATGSIGTAPTAAQQFNCFGNTVTNSGYTCWGASGASIAGVNGNALEIQNRGSAGSVLLALDNLGNLGIEKSLTVSGPISNQSNTAAFGNLTAGSGTFSGGLIGTSLIMPGGVATLYGGTSQIELGSLGSSSSFATFGNASGATGVSGATTITGGGDTIAGVATNCFETKAIGSNNLLGADCSGNFAANGKLASVAGVCPGNGSSVGTACLYSGTGAPTFFAPNGSTYMNFSGTSGSLFYVNTSGASTSGTTWTAKF